jgi:pyrimidine deaminase RibD-like protein
MSRPPVPPGDQPTPADREWLRSAIKESRHCPPSATAYSVGAVIVDAAGAEIARGHSRQGGDPHVHAEEAALAALDPADPRLAGATLYSSLEPCTERRSRPRPCTQLVLATGITRVVIAWREPPLLVADCQGVQTLRRAGITVIEIPDLAQHVTDINSHLTDAPDR